MHYKLIITEKAEELLDNIVSYIIKKFKNPKAAGDLMAEVEQVYVNLECNPEIYAYAEDSFMRQFLF